LYQTFLMSALIAGINEGDVTYGQIRQYGDFGLGTFNDLDGEMGFDGTFYQLRSDGSARPVTGDQKTPFGVVTFFRPEQELDVAQQMAKSDRKLISQVPVKSGLQQLRAVGSSPMANSPKIPSGGTMTPKSDRWSAGLFPSRRQPRSNPLFDYGRPAGLSCFSRTHIFA
jgi:alpha-acetolactate decarboxylase